MNMKWNFRPIVLIAIASSLSACQADPASETPAPVQSDDLGRVDPPGADVIWSLLPSDVEVRDTLSFRTAGGTLINLHRIEGPEVGKSVVVCEGGDANADFIEVQYEDVGRSFRLRLLVYVDATQDCRYYAMVDVAINTGPVGAGLAFSELQASGKTQPCPPDRTCLSLPGLDYFPSLEVGDVEYERVFVADQPFSDSYKTVFYSVEAGLIGFETRDGTVWTRVP